MNKSNKSQITDLTALLITLLSTATFCYLLNLKYQFFGYNDWDLAFFTQATWNILSGSQYSSLLDTKLLANHSNIIALIFAPLLAIIKHPLLLVYSKVFSFTAASYLIYTIGKEKIGPWCSIALMVLYLFYPGNLYSIFYEFHYESLAPVLILLMYLFFEKKNLYAFLASSVVLMLLKENMPLIVIAFGVLGFFKKDRNRWIWGLLTFLLGALFFYFLTSIFIPHFNAGHGHRHLGYYKEYGSSPSGIIISILLNPLKILPVIFTEQNINGYLLEIFSPLGFLPLIHIPTIFLISPIILQHLLTESPTAHTIYYHYILTVAPILFVATINSLAWLKNRRGKQIMYLFVAMLIVLGTLNFLNHRSKINYRLAINNNYANSKQWNMISSVKEDASVMSTFEFMAPLSMREHLYSFHKIYHHHYPNFKAPDSIDILLINFWDNWLARSALLAPNKTFSKIKQFYDKKNWFIADAADHIVKLTAEETPFGKIVEIDEIAESNLKKAKHTFDNSLQLHSFEVINYKGLDSAIIPIKTYWSVLNEKSKLYYVVFTIKNNSQIITERAHTIGYKIYPTMMWDANEIIADQYWIYAPLPKGTYSIEMKVVDMKNNAVTSINGESDKTILPVGQITIR